MFWDIFYKLCIEKNTSPHTIAKELGFSNAAATHWKQGSKPNSQALAKIADHFGVSTDYLLGNTTEKKPLAQQDEELAEMLEELRTRPEMKMMFSLTKGATKAEFEKALKVVEALLKKDE